MSLDLPPVYLDALRCPICTARLAIQLPGLACTGCGHGYQVVDGIPILLPPGDLDLVSAEIAAFYEQNWTPSTEGAALKAKALHEDTTSLGQRYIHDNEARVFGASASCPGTYFLDAGCGAQPRPAAGQGCTYHVCIDLSLVGLRVCRRVLGERGIYAVGSLLALPLASATMDAALASHCLYHIDAERQPAAIAELGRVLRADGICRILYANPRSLERMLLAPLAALARRLRRLRPSARNARPLYYRPLPIATILHAARSTFRRVDVRTLRLVTARISKPLMALPAVGSIVFWTLSRIERHFDLPHLASYVVYDLQR